MIPINLYSATYSGVAVYEFIHPKSSVMRRKHDGWVNATHILKVANFPKAKRTRILEKDVQTGVHEKVQGGYGKYQGTWVPLERAITIAQDFSVLDDLTPLFQYKNNGEMTPPPAPKHHHASSGAGSRKAKVTKSSTRTPKSKKVNKSKEKENDELEQLPAFNNTPPGWSIRKNNNLNVSEATKLESRRLVAPKNVIIDGTESSPVMRISDEEIIEDDKINFNSRNNRLHDDNSSISDFMTDRDLDRALAQSQTYGKGASEFVKSESILAKSNTPIYNHQAIHSMNSRDKEFAKELFLYFETNDRSKKDIPSFVLHESGGFSINQPVDIDFNTTLHLACAMGDLILCEILIRKSCNTRVLNNLGQIPLFSAVKYPNCYYRGGRTFERFLNFLSNTIFDIDDKGRTLLHEIAISTDNKEKFPAARYYTEILLRTITEMENTTAQRLGEFINRQDIEGNTALHIFTENKADRCIRILMEYNARTDIPNNKHELVREYFHKSEKLSFLNFGNSFDSPQQIQMNSIEAFPYNSLTQTRDLSFLSHPYQQSLAKYGTYHASVISPQKITMYSSSSATNVVQTQPDFIEKLSELANAFEQEINEKDTDLQEWNGRLIKANTELEKYTIDINSILTGLLSDNIKIIGTKDLEKENLESNGKIIKTTEEAMNLVNEQLLVVEDEVQSKIEHLKGLIERSQAKDLALEVQKEEGKLLQDMSQLRAFNKNNEEMKEKIVKLVILQVRRKRILNGLVNMMAGGDETKESISKYRRLLATLSGIPISTVDDSLNSIEENLKYDIEKEGN